MYINRPQPPLSIKCVWDLCVYVSKWEKNDETKSLKKRKERAQEWKRLRKRKESSKLKEIRELSVLRVEKFYSQIIHT